MEHLIRSFTRVICKLDNVDELIASFPELEKSAPSDPSFLTEENRRRLLDFPGPDIQLTNIAASTSLKTPKELTDAELNLLKERYWLGLSLEENKARSKARTQGSAALLAVSEEYFGQITSQLKKIREPLYEENEAEAIENAEQEYVRRLIQQAMGPQDAAQTALAKARPWVRRLREENKGREAWGYAIFLQPVFDSDEEKEDYLSRRDAVLFHARGALCCGDTLGARWKLQRLEWPADAVCEGESLMQRFQKLRERFRGIRDQAPEKQKTSNSSEPQRGGLLDGILRNVVLVIDQDSVDSVMLRKGDVNGMWVWALDPDYDSEPSSLEDDHGVEYRGYLRVQLKQLVNNFFEARRFHEDEYPMKKLWEAARGCKNQAFISAKDESVYQSS
ncbi:hypothetical protein AAE478_005975 [Parahypoxylon ruwenzoriense]